MMKHILMVMMWLWSWQAGAQTTVDYDFNTCVNAGYIGNGAQWDPYQLDYGEGPMDFPEAEWQKIYRRLDFMRPQLMRVVHNTATLMKDGKLNPMGNFEQVRHILDYCQQHGVSVIFGDWGWGLDRKSTRLNSSHANISYAVFCLKKKNKPHLHSPSSD